MSKQYYLRNKSLHGLPKFSSKVIILLIIILQVYMFEIYRMVFEILDKRDLVLGVKIFVKLEGEISMREMTF